jgi:hypothetical protein
MTSARTFVTPAGTDHVQVPTVEKVRTVSVSTIEEVGVQAAAWATLGEDKVRTVAVGTKRQSGARRSHHFVREFIKIT